jgi:hypothetical protein
MEKNLTYFSLIKQYLVPKGDKANNIGRVAIAIY